MDNHHSSSNVNIYPTAVLTSASLIIITSLFIRLVQVIQSIQNDRRCDITSKRSVSLLDANTSNAKDEYISANASRQQVKTMVILGSGGHTTEMIRLLQELDPNRYAPVVYVVADSDTTSIPRLQKYISEDDEAYIRNNEHQQQRHKRRWKGRNPVEKRPCPSQIELAEVFRLPRAREVHQSYFSSIFTTINSFTKTLVLVYKVQPELLLTNGPGTCVPVIYSIFLFRLLLLRQRSCKVIFVESLCRVQTLSMSGKLVYPIVDRFVVHWPYLKRKYPLVDVSDVFVRHDIDKDNG